MKRKSTNHEREVQKYTVFLTFFILVTVAAVAFMASIYEECPTCMAFGLPIVIIPLAVTMIIVINFPKQYSKRLFNIEREKMARVVALGKEVPEGMYTSEIYVTAKNESGKILIGKRSDTRDEFPGKWSVPRIAILRDEPVKYSPQKCLYEEIGIGLMPQEFSLVHKFTNATTHHAIFTVDIPIEISKVRLNKIKVTELQWVNRKEIHTLIEADEFIPIDEEAFFNHWLTK